MWEIEDTVDGGTYAEDKDGGAEAGRDTEKVRIKDGDAKVTRCARARAIDKKTRRCEDTEMRRYEIDMMRYSG